MIDLCTKACRLFNLRIVFVPFPKHHKVPLHRDATCNINEADEFNAKLHTYEKRHDVIYFYSSCT